MRDLGSRVARRAGSTPVTRTKQNAATQTGVRKTVNPPYGLDHVEDLFMSNLQTCWRRTVCQNRLRTASPQGIAALAAQGGVATLTERSDWAFSVMQFFLLTENEAPQDARYSRQVSIEVRPFVPKGICHFEKQKFLTLSNNPKSSASILHLRSVQATMTKCILRQHSMHRRLFLVNGSCYQMQCIA